MPASHGLQNTAFVCGMENEAKCLRTAGIDNPIALSGANAEQAAKVSRDLIAAGAELLVSIGLAGGLDPRLGPGAVIVANRVLSWRQSIPAESRRSTLQGLGNLIRQDTAAPVQDKQEADGMYESDPDLCAELFNLLGEKTWRGDIVGVDRAITMPGEKLALFAQTSGLACDMESHAVAEAAATAGIPFIVLRVVSDPSNRSIPQSALAGITPEGKAAPGRVLRSLVARPWELFELLSLALDARVAFTGLRRVALRGAPLFRTIR